MRIISYWTEDNRKHTIHIKDLIDPEYKRLKAENERLRKALKRYGSHEFICILEKEKRLNAAGATSTIEPVCTCGYLFARRGLWNAKKEENDIRRVD